MLKKNWKIYLIGVLIALSVGALSGILSMEGMRQYNEIAMKPDLTPPSWLFPVAWTILYILMGIGSAIIWLAPDSPQRSQGLNLYVLQLVVNFFWSLIFFNSGAYGFAALWLVLLWVLVLLMIISFSKTSRLAALLQVPYLLWLTFAGYLNIAVWLMN